MSAYGIAVQFSINVWVVTEDVDYQFILNEIIKASLIFLLGFPILSRNMLNHQGQVRELETTEKKK